MTARSPLHFARLHDALIGALAGRARPEPADLEAAERLLSAADPRCADPRAWLALGTDGRVIDFNTRAGTLLGLSAQDDRLPDLAAVLAQTPGGRGVVPVETVAGATLILQAVLLPDGRAWHLDEAPGLASPALRDAMVACWRLTPGEADVAEALLRGEGAGAIAARGGNTLGTVRQKIKQVLAKTGAASQAQAVARMAALAVARAAILPGPQGDPARRELVRLPGGGAALSCWRWGEAGGRPVLFLHGALFGVVGRAAAAAEARLFGFDVIAPERPGYGETPLPPRADPVELAVAQAGALLDALGTGPVTVLAHDVGSVHAFALARARPDLVRAIVCAPVTPPMLGWSQTADMPPMHRVSAFAAQKAPALMEKLVLLGLGRVAREGLAAIPRLVFADSAHDRERMLAPEALAGLEHLHRFVLEQQAQGFVQDMFVTNRDWSSWLPGIACPVRLLHGGQSRTVSLTAVRQMVAALPDAQVQVLPDAGHTLPLSHPAHALRLMARLAAEDQPEKAPPS